MPELPEVETVVRGLQKKLVGKTITRVDITGHRTFRNKSVDFPATLENRSIVSVQRHGKYILIEPSKKDPHDNYFLQVHLGMTGRFLWTLNSAPLVPHTHFVFHLDQSKHQFRYVDVRRFGWMEIVSKDKLKTWAPDAWLASEETLLAHFKEAAGFAKNKLLDQHFLSGLGNIYVDESLFISKIHPRARLEKLATPRKRKLIRAIKKVLGASIQLGGTSVFNYVDVNGGRGGFKRRLNVYGKFGEACSCGVTIKKMVVANRTTHFCPACQRLRAK